MLGHVVQFQPGQVTYSSMSPDTGSKYNVSTSFRLSVTSEKLTHNYILVKLKLSKSILPDHELCADSEISCHGCGCNRRSLARPVLAGSATTKSVESGA